MLFCLTSEKCSDEESTFILSLDREHSGISVETAKAEWFCNNREIPLRGMKTG
ncbi:MAG: hypothetical protein MRZ49_05055 [Lachnospiraceae bacterium]|nr:hypothetical protein [Lachnospiraceae bacterium]